MPTDFYYADTNSQPVGPLSLDEIRRFAEAGVVPSDVMICEAEGEDWKPLSSFARPPRSAPPRTAPPHRQSTGGPTAMSANPGPNVNQSEEKQEDSIWTLLWLGFVAVIVIVKALQSLKIIEF